MPTFPTFLVIGAMKAGTTSLHAYLGSHREIFVSKPKELNFFVGRRNWSLGEEWYKGQFDTRKAIRGETSPSYGKFPQISQVPERIHRLIPDVRLIYLVRDPVARAVSHYLHRRALGFETLPPMEALRRSKYLLPGRYYYQLEQYLEYFDERRILVVLSSDLRDRQSDTLRRAFKFLGADSEYISPEVNGIHNETAHKRQLSRLGSRLHRVFRVQLNRLPPRIKWNLVLYPFSSPLERPHLTPAFMSWIRNYYRQDVAGLSQHTGYDLSSWLQDIAPRTLSL